MSILEKIDKTELKELLIKNWMTHDAMWVYHCINECGVDKMNTINQAAVKSMAAIEIQRIRKLVGIPEDKKIESPDDLEAIVGTALEIVTGKFMDFTYRVKREEGIVAWKWNKCFAYEGIKGLGLLDHYKCGILIRVNSWLDTLGVKYEMSPIIDKCIMHTTGSCEGQYRIFL
jgi:hypothetical protein